MISLILILSAAFFKAVSDTLMFHFDTSVFKKLPFQFWNPKESWKYAPIIPLTRYRFDSWHLSNSFMIVCFILAVVFHEQQLKWFWEILIGGASFNVIFGFFYDWILRRK